MQLSSVDKLASPTAFGATYYGLGLLQPGAPTPATWFIQQVSPSALDFQVNGSQIQSSTWVSVTEGMAALTPQPHTGHGALASSYVFSVYYLDALGNASNTASLTYTIVANAATIGTHDNLIATNFLGMTAAAFNTAGGNKVLFATGIDRTQVRNGFKSCTFTSTTTFEYAESTRPGGFTTMEYNAATNMILEGILLTGDLNTSPYLGGFYFNGGCNNMTFNNCSSILSPTTVGPGSGSVVALVGASNITFNNLDILYCALGIAESDTGIVNNNVTFNNTTIRYCYNNFIFLANGVNFTFADTRLMSPMRQDGTHIDFFQIANGCQPTNLALHRFGMYLADGTAAAQGIFGGTPSGIVDGDYTGYISGNILTIVSASGKSPLVLGATIVGISSGVIAAGTQIQKLLTSMNLTPPDNSPGYGSTYQVSVPQTVGSAASPVQFYSAPFLDWDVNGLIFAGAATNAFVVPGLESCSIKNVTLVEWNCLQPYEVQVTGSVGQDPSFSPPNQYAAISSFNSSGPGGPPVGTLPPGFIIGMGLFVSGVDVGTITTDMGPSAGGEVYKLSRVASAALSQPMFCSFDVNIDPGHDPYFAFVNFTVPALYPVLSTVSSLYVGDRIENTIYPPNVTLGSNIVEALTRGPNFSYQATVFAGGDPTANLATLKTAADLAAMTPAQITAYVGAQLIPAASAPFTGNISASHLNQITVAGGTVPSVNQIITGSMLARGVVVGSVSGSVVTLITGQTAAAAVTGGSFNAGLHATDGSIIGAVTGTTTTPLWNDGSSTPI